MGKKMKAGTTDVTYIILPDVTVFNSECWTEIAGKERSCFYIFGLEGIFSPLYL